MSNSKENGRRSFPKCGSGRLSQTRVSTFSCGGKGMDTSGLIEQVPESSNCITLMSCKHNFHDLNDSWIDMCVDQDVHQGLVVSYKKKLNNNDNNFSQDF